MSPITGNVPADISTLIGLRISTPAAVAAALRQTRIEPGHRLLVWTNDVDRVIGVQLMETVDDALAPAHARECLRGALSNKAVGCMLVRFSANSTEPDFFDEHVKEQIRHALRVINVRLIDHLIFNAATHHSVAQLGEL